MHDEIKIILVSPHKFLQYPIKTLQGLSESEYELSYLKGGMVASILSQAHEDNIFGKLWKNVRNHTFSETETLL